jgi:hypothetical protein
MAEEKPVADERLPDEAKLRRYLLGRCSPEEEKEIELSIFWEGAQPILEVVEDELIEDYITGSLDHSDRSHFERRLLCSQAVAEKMMLVVRLRYGQDVAEKLGTRIAALTRRFQGRDAAALWNEAVRDVNRSIPHFLGRGSSPALRPLPTSAGSSSRTNRKIRIAAGIAAGMLICTALFLRSHGGHEGFQSPPHDANTSLHTLGGFGVPPPGVVIYMRRFTTEKQVEDFRSSVLTQAGRKNELPSFVESYHQLAPDHILGRWAIIIIFKKESRRDEVEGYVEGIKLDGRVDHVDMAGFPSGKHP